VVVVEMVIQTILLVGVVVLVDIELVQINLQQQLL
jgi:hypothetical protein